MPELQHADVVTLGSHSGYWVLHRWRPDLHRPGSKFADFRQPGRNGVMHGITRGVSGAEIVQRPTIEVGMSLSYAGEHVTVAEIREGSVLVTFDRREPLTADGETYTTKTWRIDVNRADLVAENVLLFVHQA